MLFKEEWRSKSLESEEKGMYLINDKVLFIPKERVLVNYSLKSNRKQNIIKLRKTASRLLYLLLTKFEEDFVSADYILYEVWDSYGLSSSEQALRRSINRVNTILREMDVDDNAIVKVDRKGYKINNVKKIFPCVLCELYVKCKAL